MYQRKQLSVRVREAELSRLLVNVLCDYCHHPLSIQGFDPEAALPSVFCQS